MNKTNFWEMTDLIRLLFVNACVILGVHFVTREDQLLGPVGDAVRQLPENLAKPLTECPPCQSSVWGSLVYWTVGAQHLQLSLRQRLLLFPFYLLAMVGFVRLIKNLLDAIRKEALEAPEE